MQLQQIQVESEASPLSMHTNLIRSGQCGYLRMSDQFRINASKHSTIGNNASRRKQGKKWLLQYFEIHNGELLWADNRRLIGTADCNRFSLASVELRVRRPKREGRKVDAGGVGWLHQRVVALAVRGAERPRVQEVASAVCGQRRDLERRWIERHQRHRRWPCHIAFSTRSSSHRRRTGRRSWRPKDTTRRRRTRRRWRTPRHGSERPLAKELQPQFSCFLQQLAWRKLQRLASTDRSARRSTIGRSTSVRTVWRSLGANGGPWRALEHH